MLLVEKQVIKRKHKTEHLFTKLDGYCYKAKNLRNATNYVIKQCYRIHTKLKQGEILDSWEKALIKRVNDAIYSYNHNKSYKLHYIDENNGYVADAYFMSYYMKTAREYKDVPYSTCSQIVIQNLCRDWKAYYKSYKEFRKNPNKFLGMPSTPHYYDTETGREWLVLTSQNFKVLSMGDIKLPAFLNGLHLKTKHTDVRQLRIKTTANSIVINIIYQVADTEMKADNSRYMGIDMGVDNLMTVVSNTEMQPFIVNGRPLKSVNQYYNKRKADLQTKAMLCNGSNKPTKRIMKLNQKRNNKVNDYLHKASKMVIMKALQYNISKIVIGNNKGWKQNVNIGKQNNQTFVSIPFYKLIQMLTYKAQQVGIEVIVVEESYTSGTSYIDNETPVKDNYDKSRREYRGLFVSNKGIAINADVNGAYQILKKRYAISYKGMESTERLNVA